MRTRPIYKIGAIVLSIVLIACGTGSTTDEATSDKINVLATTPMLGDFVNQIGGENINLTILMPPEADPHTYDPSPQDATKIADADVVFYVGLKYEPSALIKLVENTSNSDSVLVEVGESINPIEFSEEGHDDHDDKDMMTMMKKDMIMMKKDMTIMMKKVTTIMTKKDMMTMMKKVTTIMTKKDMMTMMKKVTTIMTKKDMMTMMKKVTDDHDEEGHDDHDEEGRDMMKKDMMTMMKKVMKDMKATIMVQKIHTFGSIH